MNNRILNDLPISTDFYPDSEPSTVEKIFSSDPFQEKDKFITFGYQIQSFQTDSSPRFLRSSKAQLSGLVGWNGGFSFFLILPKKAGDFLGGKRGIWGKRGAP